MKDIFIVHYDPNQQQDPTYLSEARSRAVRCRHEARSASKKLSSKCHNASKSRIQKQRSSMKASALSRSQIEYSAKLAKKAPLSSQHLNQEAKETSFVAAPSRLEQRSASSFETHTSNIDVASMAQQPAPAVDYTYYYPTYPTMDVWHDLSLLDFNNSWLSPTVDVLDTYGAVGSLAYQDLSYIDGNSFEPSCIGVTSGGQGYTYLG